MPSREKIKALFDGISPNYDKLNHLMSFNLDKVWRRKAVRKVVEGGLPVRVLDVATGSGDLAVAIAKKMPVGSSVIGLDLSEKMLAVAQDKVNHLNLQNVIDFQCGSCEELPFGEASFDRVSVAFGVRNFEDLEMGLREMYRVLVPGGRLIVLELSYPDNRLLQWCFRQYALRWLPFIGGKVSGERAAYQYLPKSILDFPKSPLFLSKLRMAGFSTVSSKSLAMGVCRLYTAEK